MKHLVIGTPCFGGMVCMEYTESILKLKEVCNKIDVRLTTMFLGNESLIQRGRNKIAHYFLKTDSTHLMFIDADQGFRASDILRMVQADKDIIGGPVPMKGINWDNVRRGALNNYQDLEKLTGHFNINKLPGHEMVNVETPFQVRHIGTGFMLIQRRVFERLTPYVGWYKTPTEKDEKVYDYFKVQNVNNELLSEDYNFCFMNDQTGGTNWVAPWCVISHNGYYSFNGQYGTG